MTGAQLARRSGKRASQSIEDIQRSEIDKTIKLTTLEQLGQALGCRLVYALVPEKPLEELLRDRARLKAQRKVGRVSHSMKLEEQGIGPMEEIRALEMLTEKLLRGDPKKLWD
jgi:predicted DNA-binding mobile mystery protein A